MRVISPTEVENEVKVESLEIALKVIPSLDLGPMEKSTLGLEVETMTKCSAWGREEEEVASQLPRAFFVEDAFERAEGEPPKRRPYFKAKESLDGSLSVCGQEAIQKVSFERNYLAQRTRADLLFLPFSQASSRLCSIIDHSHQRPTPSDQDVAQRLVEGVGKDDPMATQVSSTSSFLPIFPPLRPSNSQLYSS